MANVEIYTKPTCPFCVRAKQLLDGKGVSYTEYNIANDDEKREEMINRADGRRTVPQVFVDNEGLGGCDEIHALDRQGKLDALLNG